MNFNNQFTNLTQLPRALAWQRRLYDEFLSKGSLPSALDLPTGLGKTSVMVLWLMALANGAKLPRRLVYVVDRRAVVDQATKVAEDLRRALEQPGNATLKQQLNLSDQPLPISTLRGQFVDNRAWLDDPSVPAIIIGTVDMVGSRLLFAGYGVSPKMRSYQGGLLGCDSLVILDEAHLVPPFEALLEKIETDRFSFAGKSNEHIPPFRLLSLSATGRTRNGTVFALQDSDTSNCEITDQRLKATKTLVIVESGAEEKLEDILVREANAIAIQKPARCVVFCNSRDIAEKVAKELKKSIDEVELLVGARRVFERQEAYERLESLGFIAGVQAKSPEKSAFLIATSAGEVGVDLDAFDLVCDCVTWERMVQRWGRVNRRGERDAKVVVILELIKAPDATEQNAINEKARLDTKTQLTKEDKKSLAKHVNAIEKYEQTIAKQKAKQAPFRELFGDDANLSPGALRDLKLRALSDASIRSILEAATEKPPFRPELTRALVDAWSMTSLKTHTGRPEVAPWLRGWVDEEPQTQVIWRTHLPLLNGKLPSDKIVEDFFEAAPPHVSEILETETRRVKEWLLKLAKPKKQEVQEKLDEDAGDSYETTPVKLSPNEPVLFFLAPDNSVNQVLTWKQLTELSVKSSKEPETKALETSLTGATVMIDGKLSGLSDLGLLDAAVTSPIRTIDDNAETWIGGIQKREFGFHVFSTLEPTEAKRKGARESFRMVTQATEEGEATHWLMVVNAQTQEARSSGPPQELHVHQALAARWMDSIAKRLQLPERLRNLLVIAARLHDEGKQVDQWQRAFNAPRDGKIYAKVNAQINQTLLAGYRHEFGSLDFVNQDAEFLSLPSDEQSLVLHLIAAHHGHARPLISTNGMNKPPSALAADATALALRFASLQKQFGPWGLAWLEALLKAADARASHQNQISEEQGK